MDKTAGYGRGVLVSGTDTEVGKTYVACLLGRRLADAGTVVRPFKPVESGCPIDVHGRPVPADAAALRDAMAPDLSLSDICLYAMAAPLSPHLAARMEGMEIDVDRIRRAVLEAAPGADLVLIEGAGGLTVEIREGYSFARLAQDLLYPVLVVAENRLGVLNHVRLTMRYLESDGIPLAGVILNDRTAGDSPAALWNAAELERTCGDTFLGTVGYGSAFFPDEVFRNFQNRVLGR